MQEKDSQIENQNDDFTNIPTIDNEYITQDIENRAMFLAKITDVFFDLTRPASNIEKPAAIHMTSAPQTKK